MVSCILIHLRSSLYSSKTRIQWNNFLAGLYFLLTIGSKNAIASASYRQPWRINPYVSKYGDSTVESAKDLPRAARPVAQKVWQTSGSIATGVTVARGSHE